MSGHSKWATTHRQKAVVDAKRGAAFTKLGNMIAIAARGGTDPTTNSSLALAIEKARAMIKMLPHSKRRSTRATAQVVSASLSRQQPITRIAPIQRSALLSPRMVAPWQIAAV